MSRCRSSRQWLGPPCPTATPNRYREQRPQAVLVSLLEAGERGKAPEANEILARHPGGQPHITDFGPAKRVDKHQGQTAPVLEADRANESRLWQANFDYVRAHLCMRLASRPEYSANLANFPMIDPQRHKGGQLTVTETVRQRDAKKYAERARNYLTDIAREHADSPWEIFARRNLATSLSFEWQPLPR